MPDPVGSHPRPHRAPRMHRLRRRSPEPRRRVVIRPALALAASLLLLAGCGGGTTRSADLAPPPELLVPGTPGVATGYVALTLDEPDLDRELAEYAAAGVRWIRTDLSWGAIERTRGDYDWTAPDRVIAAVGRHGLEYLALPMGSVPDWARTGPGGGPDPDGFAAFVRTAAERYVPQGVTAWEVWNEPNTTTFWPPRPDPAAYASLLVAASREIHAVDPSALVVLGGLAAPPDDARGRWVSAPTFLREVLAAGGGAGFDAVAVHPYSYPALPGEPDPRSVVSPGSRFASLDAVHAVLESAGRGGTPVWVTEFGSPVGTSAAAGSEADQAAQLTAGFRECRARPWCGPLMVYTGRDLRDDPTDPEANFGLLRYDFSRRPAYDALAAAARSATAPTAAVSTGSSAGSATTGPASPP